MIVILINHWFVLTCIYTNNNMTGVNITLKQIVGENLRNKVQICKNMAKKKSFQNEYLWNIQFVFVFEAKQKRRVNIILSLQHYLSKNIWKIKNKKQKKLLALNYQFVPSIIRRIQFCSLQNIKVYLLNQVFWQTFLFSTFYCKKDSNKCTSCTHITTNYSKAHTCISIYLSVEIVSDININFLLFFTSQFWYQIQIQ